MQLTPFGKARTVSPSSGELTNCRKAVVNQQNLFPVGMSILKCKDQEALQVKKIGG